MDEENKKNDESTKEINLNDLYDGSVNSTVIMDPVTQNEVLIKEKKRYGIIIFIIILVIIVLGLYFVYFNTDLIKKDPEVKPNVTTTNGKKKVIEDQINGNLSCSYLNDTNNEKITSNIKFDITNSLVISSNFSLNVISKKESLSNEAKKMLDLYEKLYINNASVIGNESLFEKTDKSFSLTYKFDYDAFDFESFSIDDENINLIVKPSKDDSYESLSESYVQLGYSCTLTRSLNEE